MKKLAVAGALLAGLLATGASCASPSGPPAAGTEMDCIADGRGGVRGCEIDYDWPNGTKRTTASTTPRTPTSTPKTTTKTPTSKTTTSKKVLK